jgi:CRP/FNR family transcriptional regulator, cyclic AMP receptor protein
MSAELASRIREGLLHREGVQRIAPVRRGTVITATNSPADSVHFVDSGYVKLVQKGADGKEVILLIIPPGSIFGEDSLYDHPVRAASAQMMQEGVVYQIPRSVFLAFAESTPEVFRWLCELMAERQRELEQKIALLCLNDVEYRILHYLSTLPSIFHTGAAQESAIPLSQSELAHLIGATRETTSTTLNNLARRGLVRLGRRMLMVTSMDAVRTAAHERSGASAKVVASPNG